ncbi:MAG: 30S ribosomal protein S9 [Phycisphaeraceae bacterium]
MAEEQTPASTFPEAGTALAEPPVQPEPIAQPATPDKGGFIWGTGRRKTAVARVRIKPGDGKFLINGKEVDDFFSEPQHREQARIVLKTTKTEGQLDVFVKAHGGGITGQAGAVLLGVARALKSYDPALEPVLRDNNFLSRDPREVERKKYGQAGARKRFQFSKR